MQRGKLLRTPLAVQDRISYLREILEWVYAEEQSKQQLQADFWKWFIGATHEQATVEWRAEFDKIHAETAKWDWSTIQEQIRKAFIGQVVNRDRRKLTMAPQLPRRVGTWKASDGTRYYHYGPVLQRPLKEGQVVMLAVDQALSDLSGLKVETLAQCEQCARWFVRARGIRKRFCSAQCTWKAFKARGGRQQK